MVCKFDRFGNLCLKRNGIFKKQFCPYSQNGDGCGDYCPCLIENASFTRFDYVTTCGGDRISLIEDDRKSDEIPESVFPETWDEIEQIATCLTEQNNKGEIHEE